jgi:uncharacterized protein YcfL
MKKLSLCFIITVFLLVACTSPTVQERPKTEDQLRSEKIDADLAQLDGMIRESEAGIKHVKKKNPDPLIIIKSCKIIKSKYFNSISIKVQNNTAEEIIYMQLSWKLFDKNGKEIPKPGNTTGSVSEHISSGATKTFKWQLDNESSQSATVRLDTVRTGDTLWDYGK